MWSLAGCHSRDSLNCPGSASHVASLDLEFGGSREDGNQEYLEVPGALAMKLPVVSGGGFAEGCTPYYTG